MPWAANSWSAAWGSKHRVFYGAAKSGSATDSKLMVCHGAANSEYVQTHGLSQTANTGFTTGSKLMVCHKQQTHGLPRGNKLRVFANSWSVTGSKHRVSHGAAHSRSATAANTGSATGQQPKLRDLGAANSGFATGQETQGFPWDSKLRVYYRQ